MTGADSRPARAHRKRDRLRQLRIVCRAARLGSFTGAADELLLEPGTVSLHVRELEQELEAELFERRGPNVTLTPGGECLYALAGRLVERMDALPQAFAERIEEMTVTRRIVIGAGPAGVVFALPRALKRFQEQYPEARIRVRSDVQQTLFDLLRAGDLDFVLDTQAPAEEDFLYRPLFEYEVLLIAPEDHALARLEAVSLEEIAKWPMVAPTPGMPERALARGAILGIGHQGNIAIEAGGWNEVKRYVEVGFGIALFPSFGLSGKERVSTVSLLSDIRKRSYGVFTRRDDALSPLAEQVVRCLELWGAVPDRPDDSGSERRPSARTSRGRSFPSSGPSSPA